MKILVVCLFAVAVVRTTAAPSTLPGIQAEMRALQFDKAIDIVDQADDAKDANADQALFLKATAEFHVLLIKTEIIKSLLAWLAA